MSATTISISINVIGDDVTGVYVPPAIPANALTWLNEPITWMGEISTWA